MEKYKNQDGISLNYTGMDTHSKLVREVIAKAVKILSTYQLNSSQSMMWAMDECKRFLQVNFSLDEQNELDEMELVSQFNRNRAPEDWVQTYEEMQLKIKQMYNGLGKSGGMQ